MFDELEKQMKMMREHNQRAIQTIIDARELISDPKKWTKGTDARNEKGDSVPSNAKDAVCFCMNGALARVRPRLQDIGDIVKARNEINLTLIGPEKDLSKNFTDFNDNPGTTHADVLHVMDRTIERLSTYEST